MENFSKDAFLRLHERLKQAGPDSDLARKFVSDETFAVDLLYEVATEDAAVQNEGSNNLPDDGTRFEHNFFF
ncbi:MAG: hypothetical protein V1738_02790 [Patescibacteria group bacterium]